MSMTKVRFWCSCGAFAAASSFPAAAAADVIGSFRAMHEADGHHEVTQQEGQRIRRKQRRDELAGVTDG